MQLSFPLLGQLRPHVDVTVHNFWCLLIARGFDTLLTLSLYNMRKHKHCDQVGGSK